MIPVRKNQRQVGRRLRDNPSLAARLEELAAEAYEDARLSAAFGLSVPKSALPSAFGPGKGPAA